MRLSDAQQTRTLAGSAISPVLILGPWRSGSTVMHELLTAATGLPTPRTWQCMSPATFQLSRTPPATAIIARPMDGLSIDAQSPQEDEFALLAMGVDSAYRAFWQAGRIGEMVYTLDPAFWLQERKWLAPWESFLRGVLRSAPGSDGTVILKSPNHTYRLPAIAQHFMQLRMVWMARPAAQVFLSNRKMWNAMFALHSLPDSKASDMALDQFLAQALDRAAQVLEWCLEVLPRTQWAVVQQSDLHDVPELVTAALCRRLQLPMATEPIALEDALARVSQGRVDQYGWQVLPGTALAACHRLDEVQAIAMHRCGINKE